MDMAFSGTASVRRQVKQVFRHLADGAIPGRIERAQVDIKEEPGRRAAGGAVLPGQPRNGVTPTDCGQPAAGDLTYAERVRWCCCSYSAGGR
jgi:hypothetical protein